MLELLPDGKTFRKLTKTQTKALDRYYKREKKIQIPSSIGFALGLPIILGTSLAAFAYIFKDNLQDLVKSEYDDFKDFIVDLPKEAAKAAGGGLADLVVDTGAAIFPDNPATPEYITFPDRAPIGPLSRCKRWETDSVEWLSKVQKGDINTVQAALAAKRIIKNMKLEGCPKPAAFSQAQWDD